LACDPAISALVFVTLIRHLDVAAQVEIEKQSLKADHILISRAQFQAL
jgi:hypothetical protein